MTEAEMNQHLAGMAASAGRERSSGVVSNARPTKGAREVAADPLVIDFFTSKQPIAARILNGEDVTLETGATVSTVEAEAPAAEAPAPEAEPAVVGYDLPEDLADMLDEPDEYDEPTAEPEVEAEAEPDEYVDPQVAKLQRQLAAERKRAEHERKLRVQSSSKNWEAEARKVFNKNLELLTDSDLASIKADSHRGYFAQAKEIADRNLAVAKRFAVAAAPDTDAARAAQAQADADRWGPPVVGDPSAPAESVGYQQRLEKARRSGRLENILRVQMFPDKE